MDNDESATQKIAGALRLRRALRLVWEAAPGWTVAHVCLLLLQGVLPLLSLYLMKLLVDAVAAGLSAAERATAFQHVLLLIAFAGAVVLLSALCQSLAMLVSEAQGEVVADSMHDVVHAKSIEVDLEFYESPKCYDAFHRAQEEAPFRPSKIVHGLAQVGRSGVSLLAVGGLLLACHWGVAGVLLLAAVPGVIVRLRRSDKLYNWRRDRTAAERRCWYLHWLLTTDGHAKELRVFGLGNLFRERFQKARRRLRRELLRMSVQHSAAEFATRAAGTLAIFGAFAFIAHRTIEGRLTLGALVMYFEAFRRGQGFLEETLRGLASLYEDNLFLRNLYEFLDIRPRVVEAPDPKPVPTPIRTGVVFDHVSFTYPGGEAKVIDDLCLTIRPGEHVALVGANGAGKTTLVKLLCRLYDPTAGTVTIDGVDLRQFGLTELRARFSVIFQDYVRYHLSARENIWLGRVEAPPEEERIAAAARRSGAHEVIAGLPQGYDTILGKWFEEGAELSTGEWQKVALARAFLRETGVIVLDEPTSALDAKAEYEVFRQFRELARDRTAVLISHRFSTVRMADSIVVLEKGRISEQGGHDELVKRGGTYARLFETQAQHYR